MALADDDVHFELDHVMKWRTLGDPVDVRVLTIDVRADVDLSGEVAFDDWSRLYDSGAFHLDDEDEPMGWEPGPPIQISLRLRRPLIAGYDEAESLANELFSDPDSPLRHSEAWLMTEAMQAVPMPDDPSATSAVGIRTSWAPPLFAD